MSTLNPKPMHFPRYLKWFIFLSLLVAITAFALHISGRVYTFWPAFLTSFFYFVSLSLGGLFFVAIQHTVNAGWSVTVRRIAEGLTSFLPIAFLLGLILILFGGDSLFEWLHEEVVAGDPILQRKEPYLNLPFFVIRTVIFFGGWILLAKIIVGHSLKQDEDGDENRTHKSRRWSIGFLLFFAISYSLFSVDYLMSLHPHWFSTIFGVYCFAGLFQSALAFLIVLTVWMMKKGLLDNLVNQNHIHDLGKLLFAFTVFFAYIAFSQFMLIWYANLPEETIFFIHRAHGGWMAISYSLLLFKFIVPFLALLPRAAKRNVDWLSLIAILILVMQYVDIYWLVYPNFNEGHIVFGFTELAMFLGGLSLFLFFVMRFLSKHPIVPLKDPRTQEALHHHI